MIEELYIATKYCQRVIVKLRDGEEILGWAQYTALPDRAKIQTTEGPVWITIRDIQELKRLVYVN